MFQRPLTVPPSIVVPAGRGLIANRTAVPNEVMSDGVVTGGTSRVRHRSPLGHPAQALSLVYCNSLLNGASGEAAGTDVITVRCSIEYPSGTFYPLFFKGAGNIALGQDAVVETDPLGIDIPADTYFWSRTHVTVAGGGKFPRGFFANTGYGEGNDYAETPTDKTLSGTVTAQAGTMYGPAAIMANLGRRRPSVGLFGSSSMEGTGETTGGDTHGNKGAVQRWLKGEIGYARMADASMTVAQAVSLAGRWRRLSVMDRCGLTHVIGNLGLNDVTSGTSVATMKANLQTLWQMFADRGWKVIWCTFQPVTTSSDSWDTVENQTTNANDANRQEMNAWLLSRPSPTLTGVLNLHTPYEEPGTPSKWRAGYTVDGTHPTSAAYAAAVLTLPDVRSVISL